MKPATYDDIRQRAIHCPMVATVVGMVEGGHCSEVVALRAAVLVASEEREGYIGREVERAKRATPPIHIHHPDPDFSLPRPGWVWGALVAIGILAVCTAAFALGYALFYLT